MGMLIVLNSGCDIRLKTFVSNQKLKY